MRVSKNKMLELLDSIQSPMAEFRSALRNSGIDDRLWNELDKKASVAVDKIWDEQKKILGYE